MGGLGEAEQSWVGPVASPWSCDLPRVFLDFIYSRTGEKVLLCPGPWESPGEGGGRAKSPSAVPLEFLLSFMKTAYFL